MKRRSSITVKAVVLTLVCVFNGSGILMAQSESQDELRQLVLGAATEVENGNIERAKQILSEISVPNSTPDDIAELIVRLKSTIENIDSTQKQQAQSASGQQSSEQNITSGMSAEELQEYLEELSNAVKVLFDPEKSQ